MKEYKYKPSYYAVSILGPTLMMVGILVWGILGRLSDNPTMVHKLITLVVPVLLLSSLVALNQPGRITDDDKTLTIYGFGRKHEYEWAELKFLRVRKFIMTDKILLRIGSDRVLGGRYWLDMDSLQGGPELMSKLIANDPQFEANNKPRYKKRQVQERVKK